MVVIVKYKPNKSSKSAEFRINRRIIQEYGLEESKRVGALDSIIEQKHKHKEQKKQIKSEHKRKKHKEKQKSQKTGLHIGINYEQKSQEFIINGGDIESCPFD